MPSNKLTKKEVLDFLRANKPLFKKKFGIDGIVLFGSFARDEATPESDIDILIDMQKKDFDKWFDPSTGPSTSSGHSSGQAFQKSFNKGYS